jgi:hypothetical protein
MRLSPKTLLRAAAICLAVLPTMQCTLLLGPDLKNTSDTFKRDGHVYRIRNQEYREKGDDNIKHRNYFYVAKDNDEKWMRFEAAGSPVKGEYIFVTDKENVYVADYSGHRYLRDGKYRGDFRPHIWRNGYRIYFGE